MRTPKVKGFTVERTEAFWIACPFCDDAELVYGALLADDANAWAETHKRNCAAWVPFVVAETLGL